MKKIISVLVSICIIGNTTITSFAKDSYDADDIKLNMSKAELQVFVKENQWDFLGRDGDKLYFKLRNEYAQGDKWKELEFEIKTLPEQTQMVGKWYNDNDLIINALVFSSAIGGSLAKINKASKAVRAKNRISKWKLLDIWLKKIAR